jgi:hemerythrin-like metal-binding protein
MATHFPWLAAYNVGIVTIDEQHQRLVALINQLHGAMLTRRSKEVMGQILTQLAEYTEVHFAYEEGLMARYAYPGYHSHQEVHEQMRAKVLALAADHAAGRVIISLAVMEFLREWLTAHILGTDQLYRDFLRQEGAR